MTKRCDSKDSQEQHPPPRCLTMLRIGWLLRRMQCNLFTQIFIKSRTSSSRGSSACPKWLGTCVRVNTSLIVPFSSIAGHWTLKRVHDRDLNRCVNRVHRNPPFLPSVSLCHPLRPHLPPLLPQPHRIMPHIYAQHALRNPKKVCS